MPLWDIVTNSQDKRLEPPEDLEDSCNFQLSNLKYISIEKKLHRISLAKSSINNKFQIIKF